MGDTILVSVGLVALLVAVGVMLYALVSRARAAQDRRDHMAAARNHTDPPPSAAGEVSEAPTHDLPDRLA